MCRRSWNLIRRTPAAAISSSKSRLRLRGSITVPTVEVNTRPVAGHCGPSTRASAAWRARWARSTLTDRVGSGTVRRDRPVFGAAVEGSRGLSSALAPRVIRFTTYSHLYYQAPGRMRV